MKKIKILIIFIFSVSVSAQDISQINSDLKLSDSLTYKTEIRIYKRNGITNYSSLFRMFKNKSEKWTSEFYQHYAKVDGKTKLHTEKRTLKSHNDMEFVFLNFVRNHIFELPNMSRIKWKLITPGKVDKVQIAHRGKKREEYQLINNKVSILDGEGFKILVKNSNLTNEFEYSNPDEYLKHYSEIDELIYMCEILKIIRTEFGIWKK